MKKNFITGMLLVALTATGFSTLTSCKDTDDDLRTEIKGEQAELKTLLDKLKKDLEEKKCDCPANIVTKDDVTEMINAEVTGLGIENLKNNIQKLIDNGAVDLTKDQIENLAAIAAVAEDIVGPNSTLKQLKGWFEGVDWSVADFQNAVKSGMWVTTNKAGLESVLAKTDEIALLDKEALEALNTYASKLEDINKMYETLFPNGVTADEQWWSYKEVMDNIKANTTAIEALRKDVDALLGRINDMVTSLILQATANPVFGSFNSPFGINSMMLMSYYGNLTTGIEKFPSNGVGAEYNGKDVAVDWDAIANGKQYQLRNGDFVADINENGMVNLGNLWFTVNPGTVNNLNLDGFALVNSKEEEAKVILSDIAKDDETLFSFGISKAAGNGNGLYSANATVAPEDLDAIKVNIEPRLKESLINAVKNRTITDMAHMAKDIYKQLQNVCDAQALRYTWNSFDLDKDGNHIERENKVYSNYGIAATAFKPLSFAALYGESLRPIPTFGPIELDKDLVNLNLKPFTIGNVNLKIEIAISGIEIDDASNTMITVKVPSKYNVNVDTSGKGEATLPDNWSTTDGMYDEIQVDIKGNLDNITEAIQESVDRWIHGVPGNDQLPGLEKQLNEAVQKAIDEAFNGPDGLIASIEGQVNDMMGSIQDKLDSLVDKINSDYLSKVNNLIDRVNSVSNRINNVLSDPNHYLQAAMLYKNGSDQFGILSTDPNQPSQFKGDGEAIQLWATSYNFETICPIFKKFVGVTKVTKNGVDQPALVAAANNSSNFMATVLDRDARQVALDVTGATSGVYNYEIAYQALDYTGHTSTVKCYIQVIR